MNVAAWKRIQEVFEAVIDLPRDQRDIALRSMCADDPSLRKRVESLIYCEAGSQLDHAVGEAVMSLAAPLPNEFGNYRIGQRLGEGGMGIVYEAEQISPRRKVALKIMRSGAFASEREKRLFEREAEALARLSHPGIAAIYESGLTPQGQPYLVMEFIEGESLVDYLPRIPERGERLRVFLEICEAISYAHQRGVIHRDIKPSNIMVAQGRVKVLDFGLARLDTGVDNTRTETGVVQGSLRYMSPEQAQGEQAKVDVRSDLYALGVILYEMLAGKHPYLDRTDLLGAVQQICEAPVRKLDKELAGDLETILQKALEKEPKDRYASVSSFADDLRRYLANEPILARPATLRYQLLKLVQRNKLATGVVAAFVLLVMVAAGLVSYQNHLLGLERDRANQEAMAAKEVTGFMVKLFEDASPSRSKYQVTPQDLLIKGLNRLRADVKAKPAIRADLMHNIGSALNSTGPFEEAEKALREALQVYGEDSKEGADVMSTLSTTFYNMGKYAASAEMNERALRIRRKEWKEDEEELAGELNNLARSYASAGQREKAAEVMQEATALDRKYGREMKMSALSRMATYGSILNRLNRKEEALSALEFAAKNMKSTERSMDQMQCWNELALLYTTLKRFKDAEVYLRKTRDSAIKMFGAEHPNIGVLQVNLAAALNGDGRYDEALVLEQQTEDLLKRVLKQTHPTWADLYIFRSDTELGLKRLKEARHYADLAVKNATENLVPDHHRTLNIRFKRAMVLDKMGKADEARAELDLLLPKLKPDSEEYQAAKAYLDRKR